MSAVDRLAEQQVTADLVGMDLVGHLLKIIICNDEATLITMRDNSSLKEDIDFFQTCIDKLPNLHSGLTNFKSYTYSGSGAPAGDYYVGGYYDAPLADADLTQASATVVHGLANISYAAHAFAVASGAGSTDGSDLVLTVTGTSITDAGVRTTGDSQVIVADCTAAATDVYFETSKKWLGPITYTLTSSGGSTFDFTFNYGFCKYEDIENKDFQLTSVESVGLANVADDGFDIQLIHHKATGWTYDATAFMPGPTPLASLAGIHGTDFETAAASEFAFKRVGLATDIGGADSEGVIIRIVASKANSVDYMDVHLGFNFL